MYRNFQRHRAVLPAIARLSCATSWRIGLSLGSARGTILFLQGRRLFSESILFNIESLDNSTRCRSRGRRNCVLGNSIDVGTILCDAGDDRIRSRRNGKIARSFFVIENVTVWMASPRLLTLLRQLLSLHPLVAAYTEFDFAADCGPK